MKVYLYSFTVHVVIVHCLKTQCCFPPCGKQHCTRNILWRLSSVWPKHV